MTFILTPILCLLIYFILMIPLEMQEASFEIKTKGAFRRLEGGYLDDPIDSEHRFLQNDFTS
jgi:hypothetical protein